jgi:hypothetical protein
MIPSLKSVEIDCVDGAADSSTRYEDDEVTNTTKSKGQDSTIVLVTAET